MKPGDSLKITNVILAQNGRSFIATRHLC